MYFEQEKENLKMKEELGYTRDLRTKSDHILKHYLNFAIKTDDEDFDTVRNPKNFQMEEKTQNISKTPELSQSKKQKKNRKATANLEENNISNLSGSRNYISINNDLTNFGGSNSTFNIETNNNLNFNQNNNFMNNLLAIDAEIEQYNKLNKITEQEKNNDYNEKINKEEVKEEKKENRMMSHLRGSYENYFNIEDNQVSHFLENQRTEKEKSVTPEGNDKNSRELSNHNTSSLNKVHQEEIKNLRDDFEKKINDLIKRSENDKEAFQCKIGVLEKELHKNDKKETLDESSDGKNKEILSMQKQIEHFKNRTFEELKNSQKYNEQIEVKCRKYKEKYEQTISEFEKYRKVQEHKELKYREQIETYKGLLRNNEELKRNLENTNQEVQFLRNQVEKLTGVTKKHQENSSTRKNSLTQSKQSKGNFEYVKGQDIVNYNVSPSNNTAYDSEDGNGIQDEEKIFLLEKNLEVLKKENLNLKVKLDLLEKPTINLNSKSSNFINIKEYPVKDSVVVSERKSSHLLNSNDDHIKFNLLNETNKKKQNLSNSQTKRKDQSAPKIRKFNEGNNEYY